MKSGYYKTLTYRTVTQVADGGGSYTETTTDTTFQGYIGTMSAREIEKNKAIGSTGTMRLLTDSVLSKTGRVVDTNGYFSDAGQVYEISWAYTNQWEKYYDLKII
jgi:hypothetical protein